MLLGRMNASNALTIFSLFFGAVGTGFAIIGESQYALISLIIATIGYIYGIRFTSMFQRDDAQISFGIELDNLSRLIVFGLLPISLLITIASGSVFAVIIGSLYLLAVAIRLAHLNQSIDFQGEVEEGSTLGLPLEASGLIIPLTCLLAYVIPLNIFYYILGIIYIILGLGYILKYPVPKLPEKWLLYALGLALVLVIVYLALGTLTPAIHA